MRRESALFGNLFLERIEGSSLRFEVRIDVLGGDVVARWKALGWRNESSGSPRSELHRLLQARVTAPSFLIFFRFMDTFAAGLRRGRMVYNHRILGCLNHLKGLLHQLGRCHGLTRWGQLCWLMCHCCRSLKHGLLQHLLSGLQAEVAVGGY